MFRFWLLISALFGTMGGLISAQELLTKSTFVNSATFNFPLRPRTFPTDRFSEAPSLVAANSVENAEFPLLPVEGDEELFVTFIFQEDSSLQLPIKWISRQSMEESPLSPNLAEGIVGLNQRTLKVSNDLLAQGGKLVVSGQLKSLLKIEFRWIRPSSVFLAPDSELSLLATDGRLIKESELERGTVLSQPDIWIDSVFEAALQQGPEKLMEGLEFIAPLTQMPGRILLRAKFLGVPLNHAVKVWINGEFAGEIFPITPPLTDFGYTESDQKGLRYAGWREGSILLPLNRFLVGDNSIILKSSEGEVFVKESALQLQKDQSDSGSTNETPSLTKQSQSGKAD